MCYYEIRDVNIGLGGLLWNGGALILAGAFYYGMLVIV